jgi:hypothetical protein
MEQIFHFHFPGARRFFKLAFAQSLFKRPKVPAQIAAAYSTVGHQFLTCRYAPQIRRAPQDGCNYLFFTHLFLSAERSDFVAPALLPVLSVNGQKSSQRAPSTRGFRVDG